MGFNFSRLYPSLLFPGKTQFSEGITQAEEIQSTVHAYNPLQWSQAAMAISDVNPDVYLYSNWHPFFTAAQLSLINKLKKSNPNLYVAGVFHNVIPHESFPFQRRLTHKLLEATDLPILLSAQTESELKSIHPGKKSLKLFHPVYEQSWPEAPRETLREKHQVNENETVLLFFGLVRKYKGLDILIEALNRLDMPQLNLRLFVVGEFYIDQASIIEKISDKNRDSITVVDRFVSDDEVAEYMHISDMMVLPYRTASQSGILSNAINFELPVITSDLPGLTEHLRNGENGIIVPPADAKSLSEAIDNAAKYGIYNDMKPLVKNLKEELCWARFATELVKHFPSN